MTDTIFAPASGFGRAAVAVIRVSGPATRGLVTGLTGRTPPPPRRASLRDLRDAAGVLLDQALVISMPGPGSFTGEDVAEFHLHGGLAVRAAVLAAIAAHPGCRPAEPGEFTRRAFLAGRLDLTEVEGLADLVDAETEAQRRQALRLVRGDLRDRAEGWRDRLLDLMAGLESALDFGDEGDVPDEIDASARRAAEALARDIEAVLDRSRQAERVREGYVVVIAGRPNAGKSTLLNAVARRDVAIVSEEPGTTRDLLEVRCDLDGLPVTFVDTAGLRDSGGEVEREGMRRARARAGEADLVLWLVPPSQHSEPDAALSSPLLRVATKTDVGGAIASGTHAAVSARTGEGVADLLRLVAARLGAESSSGGEAALVAHERQRLALSGGCAALRRAAGLDWRRHPEWAAEDLRLAARALARLAGRVDVEDVLGRIFDRFCIGK